MKGLRAALEEIAHSDMVTGVRPARTPSHSKEKSALDTLHDALKSLGLDFRLIRTDDEAELTQEQVAARIRPYLGGRRVGDTGITLSVDASYIYRSNGYWRIPIRPSVWPNPLFPYYEALADLENEVQEKEGIKVTMASGEPTEED